MAKKNARTVDFKAANEYVIEVSRNIEKAEREASKRQRKESIQNARKRQAIFGCRL